MSLDHIAYRCEFCKYLNSKINSRNTCADKGITKWDKPCKFFTPIDDLPRDLEKIQDLIITLPRDSLGVLKWIVEKAIDATAVENATGFQLGEKVLINVIGEEWEYGIIKGLTQHTIEGRTDSGVTFSVKIGSVKKL